VSKITLAQIERKLRDTYGDLVPKDGIGLNDPERDAKIITRCLAAYAVKSFVECDESEAANAVVDGGDDNGIDAIHYSAAQNLLVLCQAKWRRDGKGEPDSAEVAKFCTGIKDLIDRRLERFNERVAAKQVAIDQSLQTFNCRIVLVIIHTSVVADLAEHAARHLQGLLAELNDAAPLAQIEVINQGRIYESMLRGSSPAAIDLDLSLINWGKVDAPHVAFYGTISGEQIADWWRRYGEALFERNLRSVLGSTDINQLITNTIATAPEDFWYFNNGITVTAKTIEKTPQGVGKDFGVFRAKGANIVNGAQTVSTVGVFAHDPERLKQVRIPIRVISLESAPSELGAKITKYTNTQNRIEARDFISQDPMQLRIRGELLMDGVEYNLIRRESFSSSEKSFDLEEATTALACASGDSDLAVAIKTGIGRFWADTSRAPYTTIYNGGTASYRLYNSVLVCRVIETVLRVEAAKLPKSSGARFGVIIHGNRLLASLAIKAAKLSSRLDDRAFSLDSCRKELEENVAAGIDAVVSVVESSYSSNFLAVLFKNPNKSADVMERSYRMLTGGGSPAVQLTFSLDKPDKQST